MTTSSDRAINRRNALLDQLEAAEKEWGERLETLIAKEAEFFKAVIDKRIGSGAITSRIQDGLENLSADKISTFLTGIP